MPGDARPTRTRLIAAAVLLASMAAGVVYLTSAPERNPVPGWLVAGWKLYYSVAPMEDPGDLSDLHADAASATREQCMACHGDMADSKLPLHQIHLRTKLLSRIACHECHQRIDLTPRDNVTNVVWVDVSFCKGCHSAFPEHRENGTLRPDYLDADCTECHRGKEAPEHEQPYLARGISAEECKGCHGGRQLPWTPRHEKEDWLSVHGLEALKVGKDTCFQCHDFGLKFCDVCHAEKPPSHLPEDTWRSIHPDVAKADTRVCYTCHETGFCKNCHLNHEAGWLESHPAFVNEQGQGSCTECHSTSSCDFCHSNVAVEGL